MVEANPVGVIEDRCSAQRFDQCCPLIKPQWPDLDAAGEGVSVRRLVRQRPDPAPFAEETSRDIPARKAESPCDNMEVTVHRSPSVIF